MRNIVFIITLVLSFFYQNAFSQYELTDAQRASIPTIATIKTKFKSYTYKGKAYEWFPVGFTPKGGKPVIDRVFGIKARYREVDGNGINTMSMDFYDSSSIMNVTFYGGKSGDMIYYAEYRDHVNKPFRIQTYSADGKFDVIHKRVFDIYANKMNISTHYHYIPLDYYYQ